MISYLLLVASDTREIRTSGYEILVRQNHNSFESILLICTKPKLSLIRFPTFMVYFAACCVPPLQVMLPLIFAMESSSLSSSASASLHRLN